MKLLLLSIILLFFSCRQNEEKVPDCVCTNLKVVNEFPNAEQEGIIIFPKLGAKNTYVLKPEKIDTLWDQGLYSLCTDSVFLKQLQTKNIKDSSRVVIKGVGYGTYGWCNVNVQRTIITNTTYSPGVDVAPTLRVKTIDKK
jgi:hypothetical protein